MTSLSLIRAFDGKRVLVAGASGMTGHNLYDLMQMFSANVVGTCLNQNDYYADKRPLFERVDFSDELASETFFNSHDTFDYVFICAAQSYNAIVCKNNPQELILPNLQIVSNILSNSLRTGVKKALYISSATVYQPSFNKLSEDDLDLNLEPHDIYMGIGWVKRYLEKLCLFYSQQGLMVNVVRPTNLYGRYDKTDEARCHVIPALVMRALRKEDPYKVYGNGRSIKNFIHVDDFIRDICKVAAYYNSPEPLNLCSDEEVSINDVVNMILDIVGHKPKIVHTTTNIDAVPYRNLDRSKFDALLGRESYTSIYTGLKNVISWYAVEGALNNGSPSHT